MIEFFRDVLDGPLYIGTTILSIIFIMAIIGFLMERKKLEKEAKQKIAVVATSPEVTPISPVSVTKEGAALESEPISNHVMEEANSSVEVKPPVIDFGNSNQKE